MNKYEKSRLLSDSSIQNLTKLVGGTYKYLGGSSLSVYRTGFVTLVSESVAVTVCADLELRDFEGFEDDYPQVYVFEAEPDELRKIESSGENYIQGQGQVIKAVSLIRETVVGLNNGNEEWSETCDIGVLVHLEKLTISVALITNIEVLLFVDFHENFALEQLDATAMTDGEDPLESYKVTREIIEIA